MRLARRMLAAGLLGRKQAEAPPLLVDDCEVAWNGVTGIVGSSPAITAAGSGYTVNDVLEIVTGGAGCLVRVTAVDGSGAVTARFLDAGGFGGYTTGAGKATTGGTGTGCTLNISSVRTVTCDLDAADFQVGAGSVKMTPSGQLPLGSLMSFKALASPLDLSAYSKLRFWFKNQNAISSDNRLSLLLCSDVAGRVPVDEIKLPTTPGSGSWVQAERASVAAVPFGSAIQSIALKSGSSGFLGNGYIMLDDIWAVA